MNTHFNFTALGVAAMIGLASLTACSQKPSSEEIAAQVSAAMEKAEKDKQETANQAAQASQSSAAARPNRVARTPERARPPTESAKPVCANCGVVLSVNMVEVEGKGSGAGVVAGGVVGGLVGNQVGQGSGRDLATIAGVVGGALVGNKIEKQSKKSKHYDIKVRMDDGSEHTYRQATNPDMFNGQRVKIQNDIVIKD